MATGDRSDIASRLAQLIPQGWFANGLSSTRDAVLQGIASAHAFAYSLLAYVRLQTRIATATDGFLDMIAADFFGGALIRLLGQSDASLRAQIIINILRERGTRRALTLVLTQLTGRAPIIFEPARPADTGAYGASAAFSLSRAASATYYDAAGVLRTAPSNTLRYTYAPANLSAAPVRLVEAAATNLLLQSEDFSTTWGGGLTVTTNAATGPDGNANADLLAATGAQLKSQTTAAFAAGSKVTVSVFAKRSGAATHLRLELGNTVSAWFNLQTGLVGSHGADSGNYLFGDYSISNIGSGWYRCVLTITTATVTSLLVSVYPTASNGAGSASGDQLYVWGAQAEVGAAATSYIPTTTATATRDADVLRNNMPAGSGAFGGYGVAGGYGSLLLPMQAFVTAYRSAGAGIPNVAGYGVSTAGYGVPSQAEYAALSMVQGALTDADIYAAIDSVRPAGYVVWAAISS